MYRDIVLKTIELSEKDHKFYDNYTFNHRDTIKRINLYINNRFLERTDGIFWNIGNYRAQHFAKNIEVDTKDLMPYAHGSINMMQGWALRKVVAKWAKERKIALEINDLAENCSYYGSSVVKVLDGKLDLVDLRNIYFDPLVKNIKDTNIVEKHRLNRTELNSRRDVWQNIDDVLDDDKDEYIIHEFWGYVEEDGKNVYKRAVVYLEDSEVVLDEEAMDKNPYYDFHLTKYEGRWLRVGIIERLFDLQELTNELVNQNAENSRIASLLLFQTSNQDVMGNVLEGVLSGQIVQDDTLKQVGISNTGINDFIGQLTNINLMADKICLTPDIIQGEALPSGTPFRSMATLTNAARSSFKLLRENIGERLSYLMEEEIIPILAKEINKDSIIDIIEDEGDIEMFNKALKDKVKIQAILSGNVIDPYIEDEINRMVEDSIERSGRKIEIPKGAFNFKWGIRLNVTGEAYDKAQQNLAYESAIQYMMANPQATNTPIFKQYLENNGISWWKLRPEQIEQIQQGGSPELPSVEPKQDRLMASVDTANT